MAKSVQSIDDKIKNKSQKSSIVSAIVESGTTRDKPIEKNQTQGLQIVENRSLRKTILIKPSTYEKIMKIAKNTNKKLSFNEVVNQLLENFVNE